jgi:hypothetical protein
MARYTVMFLILGLAVGLWLGFNPQAHQQTVQQWDSVKSAFLKTKTETTLKIPSLNSNSTTTVQKGSKSTTTAPNQPSFSQDWNRVSTAFEDIWISMQRFWANITARINTSR